MMGLQWLPDGDGNKKMTLKVRNSLYKPSASGLSIHFMARNLEIHILYKWLFSLELNFAIVDSRSI